MKFMNHEHMQRNILMGALFALVIIGAFALGVYTEKKSQEVTQQNDSATDKNVQYKETMSMSGALAAQLPPFALR